MFNPRLKAFRLVQRAEGDSFNWKYIVFSEQRPDVSEAEGQDGCIIITDFFYCQSSKMAQSPEDVLSVFERIFKAANRIWGPPRISEQYTGSKDDVKKPWALPKGVI